MTPRRIRVAGVRGDFLTPRGWPTPTDEWIRANTFWEPPAGWTPLPGLKPAPKNWRFWATNDAWDSAAAAYYAPLQGWRRAFNTASIASLAVLAASFAFHVPLGRAAALLIFLIGFACLVVFQARKRRMTAEMLASATKGAARARNERLARQYQRYLLDAA